jgi:hypothetical protein
LLSEDWRSELRQRDRFRPGFPKTSADGSGQNLFSPISQPNQCAAIPADFPMGLDVRTDDAASGQQPFGDRESETFGNGGSHQRFALPITPAKLGFREALEKSDATLQTAL